MQIRGDKNGQANCRESESEGGPDARSAHMCTQEPPERACAYNERSGGGGGGHRSTGSSAIT